MKEKKGEVADTSIFISVAAAAADSSTPSLSPSPQSFEQQHTFSPSVFAMILSSIGFQELSSAITNASLSGARPATVFAPSDSSLLTCPSCSLPLLLQEHSVSGLYPLHYLLTLPFGTKLETLAPNRCLTITSNSATTGIGDKPAVFVNAVEITRPDLFNNGLIIVHGIQGFVSHLSPLSCSVECMTSLSFSPAPPTAAFFIMRLMLKDAMLRLRSSGYSVLSLAMTMKYGELSDLRSMTVFALDDASIFSGAGGNAYVSDLRFHIVPNRLLMASDLVRLPAQTVLPTLERGQNLVVTTAGGGGALPPMRINYVVIKSLDLVYNTGIVVHGLSMPFPHFHQTSDGAFCHMLQSEPDFARNGGISETVAPIPGIGSMANIEDDHGL